MSDKGGRVVGLVGIGRFSVKAVAPGLDANKVKFLLLRKLDNVES
jgi:hypothetical protein